MHSHTINASLQVLPIVHDKHPYEWVDEAIHIIQRSGIQYEIGPFGTVVEGTYDQVFSVIHQVNQHLQTKGCDEWILSIQLQVRHNRDITADEKTGKFKL